MLALAVAMVPIAARAAQQATVAALPVDPSRPASLFAPVSLSGAFRVPRVDTALYVGTPWLVRDLSVVIVRRDGHRERLRATTDVPGRILGVRLPPDAAQADRIEYEARSVSATAAPYVVSADALAALNARIWPYALACGALATLAMLLCALAAVRRSRPAAWLGIAAAAQAGMLIPWLGIVRPTPDLSQPLHAALQTMLLVALAAFTLATFRPSRNVRAVTIAVWSLVALNAAAAVGGDLMQDLWRLPNAASLLLAMTFDASLIAIGVIATRGRAPGAKAFLAGASTMTVAFAGTVFGLPSAAVVGPVISVLCFAAAVYAGRRPSSAVPLQQADPPSSQRPIFGVPPPREVTTDGLTGLANRSALFAALDRAWQGARAAGTPLALLRLDIDHFRRYNDAHGPDAGDDALCRIASAVTATLPANAADALVARDGGDEICVLLPGASLTAAHGQARAHPRRRRRARDRARRRSGAPDHGQRRRRVDRSGRRR